MTFLIIFLILLLVLLIATLALYDMAISTHKKTFIRGDPDLADTGDSWAKSRAWLEALPLEEVELQSADGLKLHAWYLAAPQPTLKTALLAHGYNCTGKDDGAFARIFYEKLGYNVLMPDDRGHGKSEGNYIGFGWPDRKDYLHWIQWIIARHGPQTRIVLQGVSMGGATVLMVGGEDLPTNVKAIVSDCAYTSAEDVLAYRLKRMFKLPAFPLIPLTGLFCRLRAGYSLKEASALVQVAKTRIPILFIHGDQDIFVPTSMVYALYEKCPAAKELFIVPGAGHAESLFLDPEGYHQHVISFVTKYIPLE